MATSQHQFHNYLQQQQQQQQPQSNPFRDFYNLDGPVTYFDASNLPDHPPYIPPFHVAGFAPDGSDGAGPDMQWNNYGVESRKKRPKEQDFMENNDSQISVVDFLQQPRSFSTGLGLSLDNGRLASSGDSPFVALVGDDIERELHRQDVEIDRFFKVQGDRLKQAVLEKVQANQLQTISYVEDKFVQKLREKEAEVDIINKKNMELELQIEQLAMEAGAWQQRAKINENMVNTLKLNHQQVYARSRDSKEGCGDSEVDDTASCCNGRGIDFHLLCKGNSEMKELMTCKVCRVNEVCMLLLPCKHLCLCKECERNLSLCPLCQSSKYIGMEVFM